jgi:hypothetical protein
MLSKKILLSGQGAGGGGGGGGGGGTGAYYGYTSGASAALNTVSPGLVNTYYRRAILAFTYTSSELTNFGLSSNDVITKLRWNVTQTPLQNRMPFPNYAIRMFHIWQGTATNQTNPTNLGGLSSRNVTDVKAQHNYDAYSPGTGMHEMTLDNSFTWNGTDAIGFIFAWGQVPTNWNARGTTTRVTSGRLYYNWSDAAGTYTVTDSTSYQQSYRPAIDMFAT